MHLTQNICDMFHEHRKIITTVIINFELVPTQSEPLVRTQFWLFL